VRVQSSITYQQESIASIGFGGVILNNLTIDEKSLVSSASQNDLKNKDVVEKIRILPGTELKEFLDGVRVQSFASDSQARFKLDVWLDGLWTFDGKRAYVSKSVLRTDRATIEHKFMRNLSMRNLSRWWLDCPGLIPPAQNHLLQTLNGNEMIEAGEFYQEQVYRKPNKNPSPFCLTQVFPIRHSFEESLKRS
jgi:hypothetical protein